MSPQSTFFARSARLIVLSALFALPVLGYGVREALRGGDNNVRQWLPEGFQETRDYDWFVRHFGSEEMAVVSWPGAGLDDERLVRVAAALRVYTEPTRGDGIQPLFKEVLTSRDVLEELMAEPVRLSRAEAMSRLQGILLGPDGKTGALVVMVNEAGAADRKGALELIYSVAQSEAGLSRDEVRMGGPTVESVSLDSESQRSRYLLAAISVVVALGLAWRCLRDARLVAMVFTTAILSAGTGVAIVHFTGNSMNLLLVMMPTLVYVLALSASVHLVNYYRDALAEVTPDVAPLRAVKAGWFPCVVSAGTTAVGLGSLGVSEVIPVKQFGTYSALGVLASLPIILLFLPSLLQLWPVTRRKTGEDREQGEEESRALRLAAWVGRRHRAIAAAGLIVMGGMGLAVTKLDASVKLLNLFSPESKIIRDYTWLERHLGPLVPVEIVLAFDRDSDLTTLERMRIVDEVQRELAAIDEVGGTISAATFAPPLTIETHGSVSRQLLHRRAFDRRLEQNLPRFAELGYVKSTDKAELWRVSVRVEALNDVDYGEFLGTLINRVEPVLARHAEAGGEKIGTLYTGIVPLVYKAQRTLLSDLMTSFLTAFLIVGVVMVATLRNVRAGVVAMIPNAFPATVVFGAMSLSGMLCDIGSMMTAGVALGIAVDDTIHYLAWFRRGLNQGLTRREAIALAYQRCAGAMIQTTIICGLGLLVFSFSSFVPTSRFAWLMGAMLGTALIGDLLLLPALLASPLGRFFERKPVIEPQPATERVAELKPATV